MARNSKLVYLCLNQKVIRANKRIIPSKDTFWQGKKQCNLLTTKNRNTCNLKLTGFVFCSSMQMQICKRTNPWKRKKMCMLASGCPHVSLNCRALSLLELFRLLRFLAVALIKSHLKWYICGDPGAQSDILAHTLGCWADIQCPEPLWLSQASHLLGGSLPNLWYFCQWVF